MILVDFVQWNPLISIIVFSFIITFFLTLLYKKLISQEKMNVLKAKQKELREKMKEHKNEPEKMAEVQKEMMQATMESMKLTLKPMLITFLPLLLIFYGLRKLYMDMVGVGNIISWGWSLPMVGDGAGWLLCYIVFGFVFSLVLRKLFKL